MQKDFPNWLSNCLNSMQIEVPDLDLTPAQSRYLSKPHLIDTSEILNTHLEILDILGSYCKEPEIGLLLSEHLGEGHFGIYGYIQRNVDTLQHYLKLVAKYHALLGPYCISRYLDKDNIIFSEYEVLLNTNRPAKHDITMTMARRTLFLKKHIGSEWSPESAGFTFEEPKNLARYHAIFGENLLFNQPTNFIKLLSNQLSAPLEDSDSDLLKIILGQVDEILKDQTDNNDIVNRSKLQLINSIGSENISQEVMASLFNLSRATYQRRLEAKGTTYRKIKNEVIYQLATKALSESEARISDIALQMGYSDLSAFDRAFCKLSGGTPPLEYRKRLQH